MRIVAITIEVDMVLANLLDSLKLSMSEHVRIFRLDQIARRLNSKIV